MITREPARREPRAARGEVPQMRAVAGEPDAASARIVTVSEEARRAWPHARRCARATTEILAQVPAENAQCDGQL